jgi:NitT/TauT family transport system ATP-binding protein
MFELRNVSLRFGPQRVLDNVDFSLAPGERVGVIGPSGAGKSSLLKLAAGLLEPSTGQCVNTFRHPVLVFQEPRLLPWRSITENIEIPLLAAGMDKNQATRQAAYWLERVGLANAGARWPRELSGGMAQRA